MPYVMTYRALLHPLLQLLLIVGLLMFASSVPGQDLVVVTNPNNGIEKMTKDDVIDIYMGRYRKLSNGETALPLDLKSLNGEKARFYEVMVGKELPEINSYWARLMFSGQGSPPRQVGSVNEILGIVSVNKGALAYMDKSQVDKRVKIVFDPAP